MRFTTILLLICPVTVFLAGLVSCAPDKSASPSAPFRLHPPVLVRDEGEALAWQKVGQQVQLEVTDSAYLDLGKNEKGFHLHVKSQCKGKDAVMNSRAAFANPSKVHFGAMVPVEAQLTTETVLKCRFDMMAVNDEGSRHLFQLEDINYRPSLSGRDLVFQRDSAPVPRPSEPILIPLAELNRYSVVGEKNLRELALECEHHRLRIPSRGGELIQIANLDFRSAVGRNEDSGPLGRYTRQFCRVVAQYTDGSRALSPLLQVHFPEIHFERNMLSEPGKPLPDLFRGQVWELKNLGTEPVELQLPKPGEQRFEFVINDSANGYAKFKVRVQFEWVPTGGETAVVAAKGTIKIKMKIIDRILCHSPPVKRRYAMTNPQRTMLFYDQDGIGPWIAGTSANKAGRTFVTPWERGWQQTYNTPPHKSSKLKVEDLPRLKSNQGICDLKR